MFIRTQVYPEELDNHELKATFISFLLFWLTFKFFSVLSEIMHLNLTWNFLHIRGK